jgi:hypothetical protein
MNDRVKLFVGYVSCGLLVVLLLTLLLWPGHLGSALAPVGVGGVIAFASVNVLLLVFWLWMVADHVVNQAVKPVGPVTAALILLGVFAAVLYFLAVFAPRVRSNASQSVIPNRL